MNQVSVQKKLELLQQIRSRNEQDRRDMYHRESILYGESKYPYALEQSENVENLAPSSFSFRILLATGVLILFILSDRTDSKIFGFSAEQCFSYISQDYMSTFVSSEELPFESVVP